MSAINIERFNNTGAIGFVNRAAGDETVSVRLVRDTEVVSEAKADLYRPDLVKMGLSAHPYCGFVLPIPLDKMSPKPVDIFSSDGQIVESGARAQKISRNDFGIEATEILSVCDHSFHGIDGWVVQNGILSVAGILLPPRGSYEKIECVGQPGVVFDFKWPIHSPDSDSYYWYYPGAPYLGFRIDIDLAATDSEWPSFEFYFKIKGEDESRSRLRNVSIPKDLRLFQNLPNDFNVRRVQNLSTTVAATVAGFSDFRRLVAMASRHMKIGEDTSILDWGCGFGRICRYFNYEFPGSKTIGVEIDDLNLEWMRRHLKHVTPLQTSLDAFIDLPDDSVDLIYGISVMTHIRESQQEAWMRELTRILAPKGLMMLTTAGAGALAFSSRWMKRSHLDDWNKRGFIEIEQASDYDRDIGGGNYYIQAKQSANNTLRRWGKIVPVIEIVASVFGYQDMVIMRKPT